MIGKGCSGVDPSSHGSSPGTTIWQKASGNEFRIVREGDRGAEPFDINAKNLG
jgi:hypothetical protein